MGRVNYSGLVVAGVGFLLTRFTVTLALYESPVRFYLAGVVPLVLGLGLAAFGVALAVADVEPGVVRTTALWCLAGAGAMFVLVVLTLLGSMTGSFPDLSTLQSRTYLSNFLIGGSVGGTLTGLYAARSRRQRGELRRQANRLAVLNRLLRHEVLNAVTAIKGYAALGTDDHDVQAVIERRSDAIESTIEEVTYLARNARPGAMTAGAVDVGECLSASVASVTGRYPEVNIAVEEVPGGLRVRASDRLERVFTHLLENAAVHATEESPTVAVSVRATDATVRVTVSDDGPGLPESQQALLETGEVETFDDPDTGFGLNIVRLLVEEYRGRVETTVDETGTTVAVVLPRAARPDAPGRLVDTRLSGVTPAPSVASLVSIVATALVAGVGYGLVSEAFGGSVAGIGVFYGTADPVVGWLTHEFHSVVFGFVYVALVSLVPARYGSGLGTYVGVGLAWGVVLWAVAAGVVAPVWLWLSGIPASVPNLTVPLLASHVVWGLSLGLLTALADEYVTPRLAEPLSRLGRAVRG
jgi:signal transduction histidine kinase